MSRPADNAPSRASSRDDGFFRRLFTSIRDYAIIALDPEGRFTAWNPGAEQLLGYTEEEMLGEAFERIFTPEAARRGNPERELRTVREQGRAAEEQWHVRKDGSSFRGSGVTTVLRDAEGQLAGFVKILHEITDPEITEEALAQSEARLSGIISAAADAIVSVDEDQNIIVFNRGAEAAFGYTAEEILGQPLDLLIPESVRGIHREHVREFGESPEQARHMGHPQVLGRRKSGELFPLDASISKVEVGGEKIFTAVGRDATQSVHAAQALRESNETLEAVIRASPLALKVLDAEGRIEIWNPASERIFGWSEEEVLGQTLPTIPEEKEEEARRVREAAFHGETITGLETYRLRKDGTRVEVDLSTAPLNDAQGKVRGTVVVIEDITERKRAEAELQETTERLQALVRAAPIAVATLDLEGKVDLWNPAAERIFGWAAEEVYGRVTPLTPEDRMDELWSELEAASRGEAVVGFETERRRKDGSRVAVRISTAPLRDSTGKVRGMMSLVEDISEEKRAREEQRRLSAILEATPDFVGTADPEGHLRFVNRAGRRMLKIGLDEEISRLSIRDLYPRPSLKRILREAIPTAIREGSWSGESMLQCSDGTQIPVSQVLLAHPGSEGQVEFLSAVARDITQLRSREEALGFLATASEALSATLDYERAFQVLARLVVPRFADFCMIDVVENEAVRRVAVVHRDPTKRKLMDRLRDTAPTLQVLVGARAAIDSGESELVPDVTDAWIRAATRDDEHFRLIRELAPRSIMVVPLVARGHIFGAISLISTDPHRRYDRDDLELAEELARRAALAMDNARLYQESKQATRIRDQVLRIVAHDLRNPLNTVGLSAGLLQETIPPERTGERRQLDIIRRSIERANTLIQDLLDVAKVEAGQFVVDQEPVETAPLVEEMLDLHRVQVEDKGLRLVAEIPDTLPPIFADRNRILQLFGNLIGNAIKFTDEGAITVGAAQQGDAVLFWIRDTGPGIADDQLRHLFDPFWQARRASRAGAGLGLAISKGIVEAHHGRIWVDSEPGKGTTFYFTLPLAESGAAEHHPEERAAD